MKKRIIISSISILICIVFITSCGSRHSIPSSGTESTTAAPSVAPAASETESPAAAVQSATEETAEETTGETVPKGPVLEIGGQMYEGTPAPETLIEEIRPSVEKALDEYALFFIHMGYNLDSCVDPRSDLYGYLFGNNVYSRIYNEFYNYEYIVSYDYSVFETSEYLVFGDEYLTVNVKYKLDIEFSRPDDMRDENQKLDAVWTFRKTDKGWKLCDTFNNNTGMSEKESSDPDVRIIEFTGKDYDGTLMILNDPSRLFCGTVPEFAYDYGQTVPEMIDTYENSGYQLSGGINGGNFDDGGTGSSYTAMPIGAVIAEGIPVFSEYGYDTEYHMTGFTDDGELVLKNMSVNEALELDIRDAVYTTEKDGPFLIIGGAIMYGQLTDPSVYGAGKNPRTAIGQRADGSVLLLVINGRQPSSLGASFEDLADIMLEFGAVTASAMDGGTSSQMIWKDEILNHPFSAFGLRMCPTAWLIRDQGS